jgi:hypothetical protein
MKAVAGFILLLLGGCVATPYYESTAYEPNPYYVGGQVDMSTPVYVVGQPTYTYYHRYSPACDCIVVARPGPNGYWYDYQGRHVYTGQWAPMQPSRQAVTNYQRFYANEGRRVIRNQPAPGHVRSAPAAPGAPAAAHPRDDQQYLLTPGSPPQPWPRDRRPASSNDG